jgi:UDP-N-acetylmuramate dehydrogenase
MKDVSLKSYSTMRVGGNARELIEVTSQKECIETIRGLRNRNEKFTVIGAGSNTMWRDEGYDGTVVVMKTPGIFEEEDDTHVFVTAQAGEVWDDFVAYTVDRGWQGLEALSYIPGTVGASVIQNIGAYGAEVGDTVYAVTLYDIEKDVVAISNRDACLFGYRTSVFKQNPNKFVVLAVTCRLEKKTHSFSKYAALTERIGDGEKSIQEIRDAVIAVRKEKLPDWNTLPTCGSFFVNPYVDEHTKEVLESKYPGIPMYQTGEKYKTSAAYLIEKSGCKGICEGSAAVYDKHALVIVNKGGAAYLDIDILAKRIVREVYAATGIKLEREVETK